MKPIRIIFVLLFLTGIISISFAQSYKMVTVSSPGELEKSLGQDWNKIDSIIVKGTINKADFKTLYDCSRLGKLTVINLEHANVEGNRIPDFAFRYPNIMADYLPIERIILPDNITEIGQYAFSDMYLKKINFPVSLKRFSKGSFKACHWLEVDPLVIPEGITEIPRLCFAHCQSFRKLILPQSLQILGKASFYNTRMEEVNLPEGLETIGESAFWGSGELKRIVIPESVVNIGAGAFAQNDSLYSLKLPQGITEIPDLFLAYSNKIDTIIIPDNVVNIGIHAFQLDHGLSYIRLPKYLKSLGWYAFEATLIEEIILPETLEFIGRGAFFSLEFLKKVYCKAQNPPTAELDPINHDWGPFYWSGQNCTLYVPVGSGDLYRNAEGWQDFDQIIETDNFPSDCAIVFATECKVSAYDGTITINNPTGKPVDITVYDIYGKIITKGKMEENFNIDVTQGIYLIRAGNKTQKVIVK